MMKAMRRDEECKPLLHEDCDRNHANTSPQRASSRLERAEQSWIRLFYVFSSTWMNSILILSSKKTLTDADLEHLPSSDQCSTLFDQIIRYDWQNTPIWRILVRLFGKESTMAGLWLIPRTALRIVKLLATREIILIIGNRSPHSVTSLPTKNVAYIYALILLVSTLLEVCIHRWYVFQSTRLALRIRNVLTLAIYKHLLSISLPASHRLTTAKAVNLIAHDAPRFQRLHVELHFLWQAPLEVIVVFIFLCWIIGPVPTLIGYLVLLFLLIIQSVFLRQFHRLSAQSAIFTDERIHRFYELITGCQIVKMFNWQKPFEERVNESREKEFRNIQCTGHLRAFNLTLFFASIPIISLAVFGTMWFLGHSLRAADFFTVFAFFNQIRRPFLTYFPAALEKLSEASIALKRIQEFMQCPRRQDREVNVLYQEGGILMEDASFSWDADKVCLSALNIVIRPASFVGIIGPVGSGKSSLLAAILGEMHLTTGRLETGHSSYSYAPQSSWILPDTIRANILLGSSFDQQRYSAVLHACCLDVDISTLGQAGDLTMVGEKGVNLSGGQKARLTLARALYAEADIYLLDDPLSAVDRRVAQQIYQRCIGPQGLLKDKTRLLVTHHTQFLHDADQIIHLVDGRIQALPQKLNQLELSDNISNANEKVSHGELEIESANSDTTSIISEETLPSCNHRYQLWFSLFNSSSLGWFGLLITILLLVIGELLYDTTNYWIRLWSRQASVEQQRHRDDLSTYLILTLFTLIFASVRAHYCFHLILQASNRLHNTMLHKLVHTSLRFYESNPSGRILNRASRDQKVIDETLPVALFDGIQSFLMVLGSIVIFSLTNPWMLLPVIVLSPLCIALGYFYSCCSRQLVNMESSSRSVVFTSVATSLNGLTTIRALRRVPTFQKIFIEQLDSHTRAYMTIIGGNNWLGFWLDLISGCFAMLTVVIAVILPHPMEQSAAALSMIYGINMMTWVQSTVRQSIECEILLASAERIDEYGRLPVEEEGKGKQSLSEPPTDWPTHGAVEFRQYSLRYRPTLGPVLKEINLQVAPAEKLGIIGRTGTECRKRKF